MRKQFSKLCKNVFDASVGHTILLIPRHAGPGNIRGVLLWLTGEPDFVS